MLSCSFKCTPQNAFASENAVACSRAFDEAPIYFPIMCGGGGNVVDAFNIVEDPPADRGPLLYGALFHPP